MVLFRSCFLVFLGLLIVVAGETTVHDQPMPTIDPAFIGNITLSPSIKVNYTLELSTNGPVVLDSVMVFTARLFVNNPNRTLPEEKFHFLWLNSADHTEDISEGRYMTKLHKTFDESVVLNPGQFLMTVIVKSLTKQPGEIVCFNSTIFKLTERLNGRLKVKQQLEYQRINTTFAVDRPVHFVVNITDRFRWWNTPQYTFYWYNGSELINKTGLPHYEQNFSMPSTLHLLAVASAQFGGWPGIQENFTASSSISGKNGSFAEKLHFKESLSNCNMTRVGSTTTDQSLKLGNSLVLNITCAGSAPSAVCWNVTALNATLNETCKPPTHFHNTTHHQVTLSMDKKGWNTVQLAVYNDVSCNQLSQNYYVYDGDSVNIPALVFPIVFIILGLVIASAGGAYIVRLRRKPHVEVADFDFAPTISIRSTRSMSSLASAVKHFYSRLRRHTVGSEGEYSSINRTHSMYESL